MRSKFEYVRPVNIIEAFDIKGKFGNDGKCLAGGTDLILKWRQGKINFGYVIDLTFIPDLRYFEKTNKYIRIGATEKLSTLENNINKFYNNNNYLTCICRTVKRMCTPQLRNLATVGGNLCNASPAGDLSVLFTGLGAKVKLKSNSLEREIPLEDFFRGVNKTSLNEDEILTEIEIPIPENKVGASFNRVSRTAIDIAQVNVAVSIEIDSDNVIKKTRIAIGAVAPTVIRALEAEKILLGIKLSDINSKIIEEISLESIKNIRPVTDIRASADFRKYISKILVKRSIEESIKELVGGKA